MAIETSLVQHSVFSESMDIRSAPAVEQTADEEAAETKIPEQSQDQGDTVSISMEARALSAAGKTDESDTGTDSGSSDVEQRIEQIQKQIKQLQQEIKELQSDDSLSAEDKEKQVQAKQDELMQLQDQLMQAQKEQAKATGTTMGGGTRAEGAGSSVSTF